jgi:hypothetical protein
VSGDGPRRDRAPGDDDHGDDEQRNDEPENGERDAGDREGTSPPNETGSPGETTDASEPIDPSASLDSDEPNDSKEDREDAPLSDLRRDVDERQGRDDDDDFEELFAEMEVGDVDEAAVWAELEESTDEPMVDSDAVGGGSGEDAFGDAPTGGNKTVVEKSLCHGCPHFADPPDTACTHEGTTIEAEVDTEHFRVRECPVVAEREARDPGDFSADPE